MKYGHIAFNTVIGTVGHKGIIGLTRCLGSFWLNF